METILLSLVGLGIMEAVIKPLVTRLTQLGIKMYLKPAYNELDRLLTVPENWKSFIQDAESFIGETVIPEGLREDKAASRVVSTLIKEFDLETFLKKAKG